MEEKGVYLAIQTPRQVRKKPMYKNGMYRETDKMSDLICENYPMVLVMITIRLCDLDHLFHIL